MGRDIVVVLLVVDSYDTFRSSLLLLLVMLNGSAWVVVLESFTFSVRDKPAVPGLGLEC
jgi:hypothetical protein